MLFRSAWHRPAQLHSPHARLLSHIHLLFPEIQSYSNFLNPFSKLISKVFFLPLIKTSHFHTSQKDSLNLFHIPITAGCVGVNFTPRFNMPPWVTIKYPLYQKFSAMNKIIMPIISPCRTSRKSPPPNRRPLPPR